MRRVSSQMRVSAFQALNSACVAFFFFSVVSFCTLLWRVGVGNVIHVYVMQALVQRVREALPLCLAHPL